ncbi:cellulose-binding protein CttA-related protein [Ruminococcus flavefaciens]|uniref:cellulose-binding protein CttA-related protein n=1 Tax=Ruminococcus flavefaciens TaxID=1265 RepID=UPI000490B19C|nr:cellulose-binding protein CttA-related protein [Ruminococcus flavefaciens]
MKNSLFKRAIAAAAAVPLALTQCLTFANAVESDTATTTANVQAQSQESILKALLAIPGDAKILGPNEKGAAYNRQQSTWEQTALFLLNNIGAKDGSIDLTPYVEKVVANAGSYSDVAEKCAELLDGQKVDYTFDGKVLKITGKINKPDYNAIIKAGIGKKEIPTQSPKKAPQKVAGRYMAPASNVEIPEEYLAFIPEGYDVEKLKSIDVAAFEKKNPGFIDEVIKTIPEEKRPAADVVEGLKSGEKTIADLTNEQIVDVAQGYVAVQVEKAFSSEKLDAIRIDGTFELIIDGSKLDANQTITAELKYTCGDGETYVAGQIPGVLKQKFSDIKKTADEEINAQIDPKYNYLVQDEFDKVIDKLIKAATKADNGVTKALAFDWNYTTAQEKNNAADAITKLNAKIKSFGINKQLPPTASDIASNSKVAAAFAEISEKTNGKVTISAAEVGKLADEVGGRSIKKGDDVVVSTDLSANIFGGVGSFTAAFDDDADEVAVLKKKVEADGYQLVGSYKKAYARVDFSDIKDTGKASLSLSLDRILVTDTTTTTTSTTTTTTSSTTSSSTTTSSTTSSSTSSSTTSSSTTTSTTSSSTTTSTTSSSTTTSTTTTPPDTKKIKKQYAKAGYKTTAAFYLNTEEEFNKKQISNVALVIEYTDGTSEERTVAADDINFGTAKPTNTYEKGNTTFKYDVPVFVKDTALTDADGKAITVEAYIGVRGDADLDNTANAVDASVVLTYYAKLQTGGKAARTQLSTSPLVKAASDIYDDFAAYLADVYYDVENGVIFDNLTDKATRKNTINAVDASSILQFYAKRQVSDNQNKSDAVLWADVDANIGNSESNQ